MLPAWVLLAAAGLGLAAGLLIGAIGVGGVILVPCLIELPIAKEAGDRVTVAVASCMFSYVFVGVAGGWAYARRGSVAWRSAVWLVAAAAPGAAGGALLLTLLPPLWTKVLLYSLLLLSAAYSLYREVRGGAAPEEVEAAPGSHRDAASWRGRAARLALGVVTGLGSALTGTSGPAILLPALLSLGWPTLEALGSAQVLQVPLAVAAVVATLASRPAVLDWALGGALAAGLVPGALAGAAAAHALPVARLRLAVAIVLVIAALALLSRLLYGELAPVAL
jgi:uncharacterized membrane protein YfcA